MIESTSTGHQGQHDMNNHTMLSTLLAVLYHESGRVSVQTGATLAHSVGQARPFTEWSDLRQEARMGREMTAKELLRRFEFAPKNNNHDDLIDAMAGAIHECERTAIDRGWTVIVLDPPRPWIPFSDLPEVAKIGRRNQAQFFLSRFDMLAIAG